MINITFLVTLIYIIFMSSNNLYIVNYYSKLIDYLSYENVTIYSSLFKKFN